MRVPMVLGLAVIAASPSLVMAAPLEFSANLTTLNGAGQFTQEQLDTPGFTPSQASGTAHLVLDGDLLTVNINATGLEPNQRHPQHIHGRFSNGTPIDSTSPTLAQDLDGDNFIELLEGLPSYGPVILSLFEEDGLFPAADSGGVIDYERVFDLATTDAFGADPETGRPFGPNDLTALDLREIVLHGLTVPSGLGVDNPDLDDEITGQQDGYVAVLPVASGDIVRVGPVTAVPEPGSLGLIAVGLFGLGFIATRRMTA